MAGFERRSWDMNMTPWPSLYPAGAIDRGIPWIEEGVSTTPEAVEYHIDSQKTQAMVK